MDLDLLLVMHAKPRSVQRDGIHFEGLRYSSPTLAGYVREALMLADLCPNVYLDTSSSNRWMAYENLTLTEVFRRSLEVLGPGRLVFGSDSSFFPRGWNAEIHRIQKSSLDAIGVSVSDQQQIFHENFARLFA